MALPVSSPSGNPPPSPRHAQTPDSPRAVRIDPRAPTCHGCQYDFVRTTEVVNGQVRDVYRSVLVEARNAPLKACQPVKRPMFSLENVRGAVNTFGVLFILFAKLFRTLFSSAKVQPE